MPALKKPLTPAERKKLQWVRQRMNIGNARPEQYNMFLFEPHPDCVERHSQQTSFFSREAKVQIALGGNRSGKSYVAGMKVAHLLLWDQPPPWEDTPFVIVSNTYEQTCDICWKQNLAKIIPPEQIEHISWHSKADNRPSHVYLKEWPNRPGKNWVIEFHAVAKGRQKLQGQKIGGCWFSEQFPWDVFDEIIRGCGDSDAWFDGAHIAEFTPLEAKLCVVVEEKRKLAASGKLPGWKFYRLNTEDNKQNLQSGWFKSWFSQLDKSVAATRLTGEMPIFRGAIYPGFNTAVHVLDEKGWLQVTGKPFPGTDAPDYEPGTEGTGRYILNDHFDMLRAFPSGVRFRRGVDWGFSEEHPFVCEWGFKDGTGRWFIFDEIYDPACSRTSERIDEIKDRWPWINGIPDIYGTTYGDPSRPDLLNEFNISGIPATGADNRVEFGIEYMRNMLAIERINGRPETKLYIYAPNCPKLVEEMQTYRWVEGIATGKNPHVARLAPLKYKDDTCFPAGQLVDTPEGRKPIEAIQTGDFIVGQSGVARVDVGCTKIGYSDTIALTFSDGRCIECTPEHRLMSADGNWVEAQDALGLEIATRCEHGRTSIVTEKRSNAANMADSPGGDTCSRQRPINISRETPGHPAERYSRSSYTSRCMKTISGRFPKAWWSTTRTKTRRTTRPTTLNCLHLPTTAVSTSRTYGKPSKPRRSGIGLRRAVNGIGSMAEKCFQDARPEALSASSAATCFSQRICAGRRGSAQASVATMPDLPAESMTSTERVMSVARHFASINTQRKQVVRENVQALKLVGLERITGKTAVYCLASSDGTFFVNGVLVKNCDALRYMLVTDRGQDVPLGGESAFVAGPHDRHGVLGAKRR